MRIIMALVMIVLIGQSVFYQSSNEAAMTTDFEVLADYVIEQDWDVQSFEITMKLNGEKKEILDRKKVLNNQIKDKHPHIEETLDEYLYTVEVSPNTLQLVYRISSDQWSEDIYDQTLNYLSNLPLEPFYENGYVYSCFQSLINDKIDRNLFLEKFKQDFRLDLTNSIIEDQLSVFSGYTDQISSYIPLENEKMNIQLAIREEEKQKNTVTIGTPILVIEY
ncbi:YwmB family TATA-box binding protein [Alkalibacillus silvisoli]|uniref:TATA-box binding n=1 Tax=Alkalibacillus silvisoli TaxID=392823 RepID=A0ABN1A6C0_9BACI